MTVSPLVLPDHDEATRDIWGPIIVSKIDELVAAVNALGGYANDVAALTADTGLDVPHNLGTLDVIAQVYRKSDGATAEDLSVVRKNANTVTVTSTVAVASGVLRIVILPKV